MGRKSLVQKLEEVRDTYYAAVLSKLIERILDLEGDKLTPEELESQTECLSDENGNTIWLWRGK